MVASLSPPENQVNGHGTRDSARGADQPAREQHTIARRTETAGTEHTPGELWG
jgi:hypothetical protein